jgi:hypothetical protein
MQAICFGLHAGSRLRKRVCKAGEALVGHERSTHPSYRCVPCCLCTQEASEELAAEVEAGAASARLAWKWACYMVAAAAGGVRAVNNMSSWVNQARVEFLLQCAS